jgi:hypothetical protein
LDSSRRQSRRNTLGFSSQYSEQPNSFDEDEDDYDELFQELIPFDPESFPQSSQATHAQQPNWAQLVVVLEDQLQTDLKLALKLSPDHDTILAMAVVFRVYMLLEESFPATLNPNRDPSGLTQANESIDQQVVAAENTASPDFASAPTDIHTASLDGVRGYLERNIRERYSSMDKDNNSLSSSSLLLSLEYDVCNFVDSDASLLLLLLHAEVIF